MMHGQKNIKLCNTKYLNSLVMHTWKGKQEKLRQEALGLAACTPWIGIFLKTLISMQQQKSTSLCRSTAVTRGICNTEQPHFVFFTSEVAGSFALKTISYSTHFPQQSTENTSTDFILPEDISSIPILRNTSSGRGRPRSSAQMLKCSPCKRKLEESLKKRKLFQPGKQETKRLRRNWKGILDKQESKPMRLEKMVIR